MTEWNTDISQAPRDGEKILVKLGRPTRFNEFEVVYYQKGVPSHPWYTQDKENSLEDAAFSAWLPIPPPPKKKHRCLVDGIHMVRHNKTFLVTDGNGEHIMTALHCPFCGKAAEDEQ